MTTKLGKIQKVLDEIEIKVPVTGPQLNSILRKYPREAGELFSKDELLAGYDELVKKTALKENKSVRSILQMKPTRTISGVAPITVLTKPAPCPGRCIFCPDDARMPKSYIANEPGAQRALNSKFDPYAQVSSRLTALQSIGHKIDKAELIVLGGTWTAYPMKYREEFISECIRAMNEYGAVTGNKIERTKKMCINIDGVEKIFRQNETAAIRCVGISVETRPDCISETELHEMRRLGVTKVQIGVQSLSDEILKLNRREHTVLATKKSFNLLRSFGFKIQVHWMPNLYGSTPSRDVIDYSRLWTKDLCPDEIKIYPASIIEGTVLHDLYVAGEYKPYTNEQLSRVLIAAMKATPKYCRISRVVRDISSHDIVAGNKRTNLREDIERSLIKAGTPCLCIRCREIRVREISGKPTLNSIQYPTSTSEERFLSFDDEGGRLLGFLRLSLPKTYENAPEELVNSAVIREVHVYGPAVSIGVHGKDKVQHSGLGEKLVSKAKELAKEKNYQKLAVISAIGTRNYYRKLGFEPDGLYMSTKLM